MKWVVPHKQKLVAFLRRELGDHSNKFLRKLLEANLCRVNTRVERFGSSVVNGGDFVELSPSWKELNLKNVPQFETIYEDEFIKIINKPINWVCTDVETKKAFGPNHFLVHRLDRDTSGLLILAKSKQVLSNMIELFKQGEVSKKYLCLVDGKPKDKEGTRKSLFMKKGSFEGQTIWGSGPQGLEAITHWKCLSYGKEASLVACEPVTGRTHQIRVHMAEMSHPIIIDRQYSKFFRCKLFIQRPLLHAYQLQFSLFGKTIDVKADIPNDMKQVLTQCGINENSYR